MRRALIALAVVVSSVACIGPAGATEVTAAELRELARGAVRDPATLDELRDVTVVDGRRVPMASLLEGPDDRVAARVRALARDIPPPVDAAAARSEAKEVLAQRRFKANEVPRPLRGLLTWIGDNVLRPIGDWIAMVFDGVSARIPGGRPAAWVVLGSLFALLVWALVRRWSRSQVSRAHERARVLLETSMNASELDHEAELAEGRGDLESAMRLRFRAGLLRLDEMEVIEFRTSMTSVEVARLLRSPDFDALARTFDEIVYGGRSPTSQDLVSSRRAWERVLERRP